MLRKPFALSGQMQKMLLFFLTMAIVVFLYTFLHEGGHALVGVLSGGSIQVFNVSFLDLGAHVEMEVNFTRTQLILNNLAGVSLPILVWLVFILAVPRRANVELENLKIAVSIMFLSPLLAWVVLPLLILGGSSASDDSVNFLHNSGVHPLAVSAVALLVFCGAWFLWSRRIAGLRQELELFRQKEASPITPEVRRTAFALLAVGLVCGLVAFGANGFKLSAARAEINWVPQGYTLVKQVQLSPQQALQASEVYSFQLDQPAVVGVYLLVENMRSDLLEFKLTGPDSYQKLLLHAEGYTAYRDTPHVEIQLPAGQYHCLVTSQSSDGTVSIFFKTQP